MNGGQAADATEVERRGFQPRTFYLVAPRGLSPMNLTIGD